MARAGPGPAARSATSGPPARCPGGRGLLAVARGDPDVAPHRCPCFTSHINPRKPTLTHDKRQQATIPEERRLEILHAIGTRALLRADEIAGQFSVSAETVRRDFVALEREGLLRRVYGGATRAAPRAVEAPFAQRRARHLEGKRAMGRLAASLVAPGETLMFDVGTSVADVARQLPATYRGRVLTNSLLVAGELADREGIEVLTSGGRVRPGDLACSGAHAQAFFAGYYADKAFLGSGGVQVEAGLTDYHPDEIPCRQLMLDHASERYVLADASKLGQVALARVCGLDRITAVITDGDADPTVLETLRDAGVDVLVAPVATAGLRAG